MALCSLPYGIGFCILSVKAYMVMCKFTFFNREPEKHDFYKYTDKRSTATILISFLASLV